MTSLKSKICSGKRLLILGGLRYQIPVIKKAQELGCYVISADIYPDNIAHKYSNEYFNLDIVNKKEVYEAAKSLSVDGIMSFAVDPGVVSAAYACERLDLPSVGPYDSVRILQNKDLFRSFLCENGFNTPRYASYGKYSELVEELSSFNFPLFVKPVDSAGSKGVTKALDIKELKNAFDLALEKSICGKVIIEEAIDCQEQPSDSDCFSVNGDLIFFSMSNQYYDVEAANPYTPAAFIWPSCVPGIFRAKSREETQRLITLLEMGTSVYNIETRMGKDEKLYIMECSPRGGGNRISEILDLQFGIDIIRNSILGALGMYNEIDFSFNPSAYPIWGEIVLHSNVQGTFEKIQIDDYVKDFIHEVDLWVEPGDQVGDFTGANATIGTIILKAKAISVLEDIIASKHNLIRTKVRATERIVSD